MVPIMLKGGKGLPETRRELHRHPEKTSLLLMARISSLAPNPLARRTTRPDLDLILIPGIGERTSSGDPKEPNFTPPVILSISSLNILPFPFGSFFLIEKNKQEHDHRIETRNKRV